MIIPGASPFIITGMRQAFLRAWIAVVGAEMIAASDWGLGWVIFDAKEFLNTDVMLASLVVIGGIGFVFERVVFGSLEQRHGAALGHGADGEGLKRMSEAGQAVRCCGASTSAASRASRSTGRRSTTPITAR